MDLIIYSIPAFFILIGIELLVARLRNTKLYRLNDAITNINCGITQQVTNIFFRAATFVLYVVIYQNLRIWDIPVTWWTWVLLFIAVDFFYYWFHRYAHEISVFWGTHVVHHQSEDYNLSVALRQSAIQTFFSTWFYLPLALFGFDPVSFITINAIQTLYQFWIHTQTIDKLPKWFEFVLNTPSHHRVHHGIDPQYIDKNHGGTFIIFDRMFGTFVEEKEPVHFGVTKQLSSWNPVWANIDYYKGLFQTARQVRSFRDLVRVLFKKPGWRPDYLGGPITPQPVSDDYQKYDADVQDPLFHTYTLLHFVLILSLSSLFLFMAAGLPWVDRAIACILILWSVMTNGVLLEKKAWAYRSEWFRLITIGFYLGVSFWTTTYFLPAVAIWAVVILISATVLAKFRSTYINSNPQLLTNN
jgi:alkylglycerol monooxygenase